MSRTQCWSTMVSNRWVVRPTVYLRTRGDPATPVVTVVDVFYSCITSSIAVRRVSRTIIRSRCHGVQETLKAEIFQMLNTRWCRRDTSGSLHARGNVSCDVAFAA